MTIQELASKAGVTTRTIRYYTEQGLLPSPARGRPAEYGEEYVALLELIRGLKAQYLPLEEIRETMSRLSSDEIKDLINKYTPDEPARPQEDSASDYIASILERGTTRAGLKEARPPYHRPAPPPSAIQPAAPMPSATLPPSQESIQSLSAKPEQPEETWHRAPLAPGIELHFTDTPGTGNRQIAARIISAVRHILDSVPAKEQE